ncbi:hypothetical protein MAR_002312 [Mya arenaria]|uniref:Uncharacterized protein n=1 Tax=Mya arenaria TaxID=6604 RepID=A0ABY7FGF3_MYAAR|nr:hypothetical protein MAR_002312 [Mya arenaria]
MYIYQLPI